MILWHSLCQNSYKRPDEVLDAAISTPLMRDKTGMLYITNQGLPISLLLSCVGKEPDRRPTEGKYGLPGDAATGIEVGSGIHRRSAVTMAWIVLS